MVSINEERYFVSHGQWTNATSSHGKNVIINSTDRTTGAGYAHIGVYNGDGKRVADITLTKEGELEYHIGGIHYDGEKIWATLAQYRPNPSATVIAVDPETLEYEKLFSYRDHLGGVVHDKQDATLATLNWGSRNASLWNLTGLGPTDEFQMPVKVVRNPSFYADYQDCKFLGRSGLYDHRPVMMCSGVTKLSNNGTIGGLAILDVQAMIPLSEVPLTMESDLGTPITQNPFDVAVVDGRMRVCFLPDQHNSTLYMYEAVQDSPFEFGGGPI